MVETKDPLRILFWLFGEERLGPKLGQARLARGDAHYSSPPLSMRCTTAVRSPRWTEGRQSGRPVHSDRTHQTTSPVATPSVLVEERPQNLMTLANLNRWPRPHVPNVHPPNSAAARHFFRSSSSTTRAAMPLIFLAQEILPVNPARFQDHTSYIKSRTR